MTALSADTDIFEPSWTEDFIKNIGYVTVGGTPSTSVEKYWGGEIPWMSSGDVHLKRIHDVPGRISELGLHSSNATLVNPPAVAIGLAGQGRTRGTVALVLTPLCTNQSVALIQGKEGNLDVFYLFYDLEFRYQELRSRSAGGGRAGLSKGILEQLPISLPSIDEQQAIASVFSTIDRAIEQTQAIIAKQQRIKTGLMQDLLTKGIDEDGNVRSEATHEFKDSPLGRIPVEWEFFSIQDMASKDLHSTAIGPFGSNLVASDYREEGVPVVFVRDLKEWIFSWISNVFISQKKAQELKAHRVNANDVVATKMGLPPCVAAVYPNDMPEGIITADIIKLTPNRKIADSIWVAMFINTERVHSQVRQITGGVTRPKITLHDFRNLIIALPKKEEQEQIIYAIESINDQIRKSILEIKKYQKTKTGLMQDLLTGNVRVTALLNDRVNTSP